MSSYFLILCWKNLWRNRRRTLLTINAIALGVMTLVWMRNYLDSLYDQAIENAIKFQSGHATVSHPDYQQHHEPSRFLRFSGPFERWFADQAEVRSYSPRVHVQGMISSPHGSTNIWFMGVEPEMETTLTEFHRNMVEGSFLESKSNTPPIVIGSKLADRLKLKVGTKVVVLTQGVDGSIGNELFRVSGIFETRSNYDKGMAFIPLDAARSLLSLPEGAVHEISVLLKGQKYLSDFQSRFNNKFNGDDSKFFAWMDLQQQLMGIIDLNKSANAIVMMLVLFIAAIGISNSILMSILERTREFGVMMAIGTLKREMIYLVLGETLLLSLVGVFVGNLLGVGITLYFGHFGFDLRWLTSQEITIGGHIVNTVSYPAVNVLNNLAISATILGLSVLASLIPIQHISKLKAIQALRSN